MNAPFPIPARETSALEAKAVRWEAMVAEHRETLNEVIAIADAHPKDWLLRGLGKQARGALSALERAAADPQISDSAYGSLGDWGPNGHASRIAGLLSSARRAAGEFSA